MKSPFKRSDNYCSYSTFKKNDYKASAFWHYQRPHKTKKSLTTALKMYNSNVLSTLLYRAQTWQLKQTEEKMLLTASVCEWFFESDGSNKLPTKRSAWQLTIHLYQTPSGRDDSGFCVFDTLSNSRLGKQVVYQPLKRQNRYLGSCAIMHFVVFVFKRKT